jgi:hypothetical protein
MPRDTGLYVEGQRDLLRALRDLPRELSDEIRDASREIAEEGAADIRRAARTRAEQRAAESVRTVRDRVPAIRAGGGSRTTGGPMFYGTEFGGQRRATTQQFRPWSGRRGYWFYPTVRKRIREWADLWVDGVDRATRVWGNR